MATMAMQYFKSIKDFMNANGVKQADIAGALNVSATAVSNWLTGPIDPARSHVEEMGDYLAAQADKPSKVKMPNIWAVRCLLVANAGNNYNDKDAENSVGERLEKFHDDVEAHYIFDGDGGYSISLEKQCK